ncbi:hypothetical protein T552_01771 [Pneumocystis carinii B80]|uniref:Uncharacterized protein n=1 Tax=Pneumocystis carinii (strain B80) TaxID=1408658 RepID=A0A0W4ZJG9_PNEC8|nr:hypothetical protein T552_01771 [Pneumocystis carinii B80]KTW28512.1 hypothetical protein T552_01771 [Pneumocystis carinii B80]
MESKEQGEQHNTRDLHDYYKSRIKLTEKTRYEDIYIRLEEMQEGLSKMHLLEGSLQEAIEEIEAINEKNIELVDILREVIGENIVLRSKVQMYQKKYGYNVSNYSKILNNQPKHQQYYETMISLLENRIKAQKRLPCDYKRMNELIEKCKKLEQVVFEGIQEILRERKTRENYEIQVKEAKARIELQEKELKKKIEEVNYTSKIKLDQNASQMFMLQQQNEELKHKLIESQNKIDNIKKHSYDTIQEFEKQIKQLKKRRITKISPELLLEIASLYIKIKSIERIALKFAPLEGPHVNELFSDIELVKKRAQHIENLLFDKKKKCKY